MISLGVNEEFQQVKSFPIQECVPNNSQICYRITGETNIEFSTNSGQIWKTGWRAPTWRADYFHRMMHIPLSCDKFPDFIPQDLIILPIQNGDYIVVTALGNQGLVTYQPDKGWVQLAVGERMAEPNYPAIQRDKLVTLPAVIPVETILWILLGFATPHFLISKWRSSEQTDTRKTQKKKWLFFIWPFILLLIWHLVSDYAELELEVYPPYLIFILLVAFFGGLEMIPYSLAMLLGTLGLFYINYGWITTRIERKFAGDLISQFRKICLRSSLLLFLAGWLPFAFWALGWIPIYWLAFLFSFGLAIAVYLTALQTLERFSPN